MTRKDFELIAAVVASLPGDTEVHADYIADLLADALATSNPRFNRDRFMRACGVA